jgi:hypothetical protein
LADASQIGTPVPAVVRLVDLQYLQAARLEQ